MQGGISRKAWLYTVMACTKVKPLNGIRKLLKRAETKSECLKRERQTTFHAYHQCQSAGKNCDVASVHLGHVNRHQKKRNTLAPTALLATTTGNVFYENEERSRSCCYFQREQKCEDKENEENGSGVVNFVKFGTNIRRSSSVNE